MNAAELTNALNWRYATKQFDPEKHIPDDVWKALLESLLLAPSSFGLQPWKFFVVENPELRAKLREKSWGQGQVTDADKLVVLTARTDLSADDVDRWINRLSEVHGQSPDDLKSMGDMVKGFSQGMDQKGRHAWNVRQTYIALGQFMTAAAALGVDTCPLEGIDPAAYDVELDLLESGYATCVACVAGYRAGADKYATKPKARFPHDEVIETI